MIPTENLRRQHRQLLDYAERLANLIADVEMLQERSNEARALLSSMSGVLTVHLAMEDGVIYPRLAKHSSPSVRELSLKYVDEMGGLRTAYGAFTEKWRTAETIARDPAGFARAARGILQALGRRIDRENNELYPLVDGTDINGRAVA